MKVFDLHCDTLLRCLLEDRSLFENDLSVDLKRGIEIETWVQTFACFLDDSYRGKEAFEHFSKMQQLFVSFLEENKQIMSQYAGGTPKNHHCNAILSIEGGHALGGDIENVHVIKKMGVKLFSLVWNGDNKLASGSDGKGGVTEYGKRVIKLLEKENIIVDISHLNDRSTNETLFVAQKPLVATHSNARSICNHKRNLQDEQIKKLIGLKGLCGMNYFPLFINGKNDYDYDAFKRHIDHFLSLGGENILALGSDFDGASMPDILKDVTYLYSLYDNVVKWYGTKLADKIFFENANEFYNRNIVS